MSFLHMAGTTCCWLLLVARTAQAHAVAAAEVAGGSSTRDGTCTNGASCDASEVEQAEAGEATSMRSELLQHHISHKAPVQHAANATAAVPGEIIEFYAYRTVSDKVYFPQNINMGNLEGVMWYLHHEIVVQCPRRFTKTKIQRFKITYKTTPEMVEQGKNFGWRYAFDSGSCSDFNRGCVRKDYKKNGYIIGCNNFWDRWAYPGNHVWDRNSHGRNMTHAYQKGIWYSFPGECPDRKYWEHDYVCKKYTPGGQCDSPTGAHDCTYSMEAKGEVSLDEVIGQGVHGSDRWWCNRGCKEYIWGRDTGRCTNWWSGFWDIGKSEARLQAMRAAFEAKYPGEPELPDPVCDFNNPRRGYFRY